MTVLLVEVAIITESHEVWIGLFDRGGGIGNL
jgi:hypothetical protein